MKMLRVNEDNFAIFRQFMHYYLNEIYGYIDGIEMDEYGNFLYQGIEDYLSDRALKAFLIYDEEKYKGFLMLNSGRYIPAGYDYGIHELYVAKPYRLKGIATRVLHALFHFYKGKYIVMELEKNLSAIQFWHHFYDVHHIAYRENRHLIDNETCLVQTFLIS